MPRAAATADDRAAARVDAADRVAAHARRAREAIEARELGLLAIGILRASGAAVGAGEREVHHRAVRRELHASLELANRAVDVAGLEQDLSQRVACDGRRGRFRCRGLRPRARRLEVAAADVRERDLQLRPDVMRLRSARA